MTTVARPADFKGDLEIMKHRCNTSCPNAVVGHPLTSGDHVDLAFGFPPKARGNDAPRGPLPQ
jgi:hypothetical protein